MADLTNTRHLTEEELLWHYYGEENAIDGQAHLDACRQCSADFRALQSEMASLDTFTPPNPAPGYEDRLWRSLVRRDPALRPRWWKNLFAPKRLALVGGLATLVLAAFFAGRVTSQPPAVAENLPPSPEVRERLLLSALSDHLERSERILLEIDNRQLKNEQQQAENLLAANRLYRQTALLEDKPALAATLEDLERVLVEVAHAPDNLSPDQQRRLQARIADQELLFKVQVLGQRMRQMIQQPVPRGTEAIPSSNSMKG